MEIWIDGILIVLFVIVIYQDFKFHGISWFLFPLAFAGLFFKGLQSIEIAEQIKYLLLNIGIIFLHLAGISLYFSIKYMTKIYNIL